ncbi:MAG: alpha/beta hydrolase [Anaerolineales bacterium]|nr:alpha/beta hydrolase [Anaerolineales bacterium]
MKINWKYWARLFFAFVVEVIIALAVLIAGLSYASVDHYLHPPRIIPPGTTLVERKVKFQEVDLLTEDGIRLSAWYTPPKNGTVILLAHGYGDNRPEWVHVFLAKADYGVLAWDARAHGESDGEISTVGYFEVMDVKAGLDYVSTQPDIKHIGAWGGSMGGATMIRAAAQFPQIEALVVDSPYSSLDDEFDYLVPYPFINLLVKFFAEIQTGLDINTLRPVDEIAKISPRPVYIIQGAGDKVVPAGTAEQLFNAAGEPRFLWTEENVIHLGMYLDNPRKYERRVTGFFDEYLLGK